LSPEKDRLTFVTKGALRRPITFEIDGKTYQVSRLNRACFEEAQKLEAQAAKGKAAALYAQLSLVSNVPQAVADELDVQDLRDLLAGIRKRIAKAEPAGEEKNVSKPGGTPAA
jgi:hypothetical protein